MPGIRCADAWGNAIKEHVGAVAPVNGRPIRVRASGAVAVARKVCPVSDHAGLTSAAVVAARSERAGQFTGKLTNAPNTKGNSLA